MIKPIRNLVFGLLVASVGLASGLGNNPVMAQNAQWNSLFDRIIRLESTVKSMNRGGGSGISAPSGGSNAQMRQILNEIRSLRQQMLGMDARVRRLEALGRSGSLRRKLPRQPVQRNLPTRVTKQRAPQFPTASQNGFPANGIQEYDTPRITTQIGEPRVPNPVILPRAPTNWQTGSRAPVKRTPLPQQKLPRNQGQVATIPAPQTGGVVRQALDGNQATEKSVARRLYDRASSDFRSRRFGSAESGFKSFVRKYGNDALASSAQFKLGETYYVQKNYRLAAQAYLQGYRKYPSGRRGGDSLLKLGMSLQKLGQKSQSCGAFETVVNKYKSSPGTVARAKKEMQRGRC